MMSPNNNHHPEFQNQHRVPAVYLKKFSFRERGVWFVSVLEKGKSRTERKPIKKFTTEVNIFDYVLVEEMGLRRHFENTCARVEVEYNRILEGVRTKGQLS